MSNSKKQRVLAYNLAKEISHEQMSEVSGGMQQSFRTTFQPSGSGSMKQLDASVDVSVDW